MQGMTKSARIMDIKSRFIDGARMSINTISNNYQISTKTAKRYINELIDSGVALTCNGTGPNALWSAMPASRRIEVCYTLNDISSLFFAKRFFDFLENTSLEDSLNRVYQRIESKLLNKKDLDNAKKLERKVYLIHEGPKKLPPKTSEILDECLTSILRENRLKITYKDSQGETRKDLLLEPCTITMYKRGIYLIAATQQDTKKIKIYSLERITKAECQKGSKYDYPNNWNPKEYFKDAFCIVKGTPQKVVLNFTPGTAPFIKLREFHHSQKTKKLKDGTIEMTLKVPIEFELVNWVLSFGKWIKVVSPQSLKNQITTHLKEALDQYE